MAILGLDCGVWGDIVFHNMIVTVYDQSGTFFSEMSKSAAIQWCYDYPNYTWIDRGIIAVDN